MTLEIYIAGALQYRIANWLPRSADDSTSDGRLIGGEWLETTVAPWAYHATGDRWAASYRIGITIPSTLRLETSETVIDFIENPSGFQPPAQPVSTWRGSSVAVGPSYVEASVGRGIRWDLFEDLQHYEFTEESWRLGLKLNFRRITQQILRDENNSIIMRTSPAYGSTVMRDA